MALWVGVIWTTRARPNRAFCRRTVCQVSGGSSASARGPAWTDGPIIIAAHPARVRFSRTEKLSGTLVWCYQLDPTATARLTGSCQVTRPISRPGWFIIGRQDLLIFP
jgi:hypothetical protein